MHCSLQNLIVTKPTSPQIHNVSFSPIQACVPLSTRYRASEKGNQSALIRHVWLEIFIYLFILPACLFCVCSLAPAPAHHAVTVREAVDSQMSTVLYTVPLSHQPQTITKPCPPADSLPFPHAGASPLRLFFFFFFPTELPHSLRTVYVGGIVK